MAVNLATLQMDPLASFAPVQEPGPINLHAASEATVSKTQKYIHVTKHPRTKFNVNC